MSRATNLKECYCHTCEKDFHYLGIAKHRRSHTDKGQSCEITYTHGDRYFHPAKVKKENPTESSPCES